MAQIIELNESYRDGLEKQWAPVIEVEGLKDITSAQMKRDCAVILENTYKRICKDGFNPAILEQLITEEVDMGKNSRFGSYGTSAGGSTVTGQGFNGVKGGVDNNLKWAPNADTGISAGQSWNQTDQRLMLATIPLARRMFTQLLAHQLVGVQTMAGPTGYASAIRYVYGDGRDDNKLSGKEMVFGAFDPAFSGASEEITLNNPAFAKANSDATYPLFPKGSSSNVLKAQGAWVQDMESSHFGATDNANKIARGSFKLEKKLFEAKSRKMATSFSIEDMEDLMAMQGLNVNEELVGILGNEVKNEIDRELLQTMVLACIGDADKAKKSFSTWDPTKADGADQMKRLATLLTQVYVKSKKIQFLTKQGSANWMVAGSEVGGYLERMGDYALMNPDVDVDSAAIAYAGTLKRGAIKVYNDAMTDIPYILLGWKGQHVNQTGVVFAPYVPVQMMEGPDPDALGGRRILCRSRYAVVDSLFGAELYYQYIQIENLSGAEYGSFNGETKAAAKYVSISGKVDTQV